MIHEEKFLISKRPYAVDLQDFRLRASGGAMTYAVHVGAVWFRRRKGVTVAVIGNLWDFQSTPAPVDVHEALRRHTDGRYGGSWIARWDGDSYVSEEPQPPEEMERHLAILRPMLENYPAVPPGYCGWYRFENAEERRHARPVRGGG